MLAGTPTVQGAVNMTGGTWIIDDTLERDSTAMITLGGGTTMIDHGGNGAAPGPKLELGHRAQHCVGDQGKWNAHKDNVLE